MFKTHHRTKMSYREIQWGLCWYSYNTNATHTSHFKVCQNINTHTSSCCCWCYCCYYYYLF